MTAAMRAAERWRAGVEASAQRYRNGIAGLGDGFWRWLIAEQKRCRLRQLAAVARLVGLVADTPAEIIADKVEEQSFDPARL